MAQSGWIQGQKGSISLVRAGRLMPLLAALVVVTGCGAKGDPTANRSGGTTKSQTTAVKRAAAKQWHLAARVTGRLSAPLQDAAPAVVGNGVALLGGLSAADTSTDTILRANASGARLTGHLPTPVHDAAAATLGGRVYLFGGGDVSQFADIVQAPSSPAGKLPAPSSDQTAATIGHTAYIVGGYTGTQWLDTIVAFDPAKGPRVVAHLPTPVRYAAVTAADGVLVVAGGSLPNGTASNAVYLWKPGSRRVRLAGRLPAVTTHAAGAALGGTAYVLGGRGATVDTPTDRVIAVDVHRGTVRLAGRLPEPVSDASGAGLRSRILLVGGHTASGTSDAIVSLTPHAPSAARHSSTARVSNVYAADAAGALHGAARHARDLVYVPNSLSNTVDVIDQHTFRIVEHFAVGALPQHVTPAWDLRTLYVLNDDGNSLTTIDPTTGKPGRTIPVDDPYNMYFTPDGRYAIVVAERLHRLDFRDAQTFKLHRSVTVPCAGVDHMDFSADGSYAIASCEFSGQLLKIDIPNQRIAGVLTLPDGSTGMPQDVKLSPDGRVFYVADMMANGLWKVDGDSFRVTGFLPTGRGTHGLYPSRDARFLYATNRGEGSISVIDFKTEKVVHKWWIPGGGSPDMGGVSADGSVLWLSGRYNGVVYAISTTDGRLLAKIPVGSGPHGLCVWPQPGRYSLGHTGILR
jgi:DNA-binding beta-propeller fold protein YncE